MAYNPAANYTYTNTPFGTKPEAVPMPKPSEDLAQQIPGLTNLNASAAGVIGSELSGQLSPDTLAAIRNAGASWGVQNGMPGLGGGTIGSNRTLRDVGLTSMQQQQQGIKDYSTFAPVVSATQTVNPSLQADINQNNSVNAAAPDPGMAAGYAESLFNRYLSQLNQPAAGSKNLNPFNRTNPFDKSQAKNSYEERNLAGGITRSYKF